MEIAQALFDPAAPAGLSYPWLPTKFQLVILRNWNLVPVERLAATLAATPAQVREAAAALGLPPPASEKCLRRWADRGYLTVIRANWEILPTEQLLQLLGWERRKLVRVLLEEDFMWTKMGAFKPKCAEVRRRELTYEEKITTGMIRKVIGPLAAPRPGDEEAFAFLDFEERPTPPPARLPQQEKLRMLYPYALPYGDILSDGAPDAFPEGMLAACAESGINALWIPALLNDLTPWTGDADLYPGWEERQRNLRRITAKLRRYGLSLYLYLNEPRSMPPSVIAERHPDWGGSIRADGVIQALCTRNPEVPAALRRGIADLFTAVPDLGGIFTITMSENLTHCASKPNVEVNCPRCRGDRSAAPHVAAVLGAMRDGLRDAKSSARLIAWNWGWSYAPDADAIPGAIPPDIDIMSVSEEKNEFETFGIKGETSDYSIAYPGPSRTALAFWNKVRSPQRRLIAKMQLNATWELSSLPAIPTPQLVRRHIDNVRAAGVDDFMLSWTLGGFYGGNLPLVEADLPTFFRRRFGTLAAAAESATAEFSAGFSVFPQHGTGVLYHGPQNFGCADPLYEEPTGRRSTMVGFPYDNLEYWRSKDHYTTEQLETIFHAMADRWERGLEILAGTDTGAASADERRNFEELQRIAEAAYCILKSSANQISFYRRRDAGKFSECLPFAEAEEALARRFLKALRQDSRIGFEASNHYLYTANTLWEKVLNCLWLRRSR